MYNYSRTRGVGPQFAGTPRIGLPRKRLHVVIILPFASEEGKNEVQILCANGDSAGLRASGIAQLRDGKTSLEVKMDLMSLSPDDYQIGIRRVPFNRLPIPVEIR